MTELEKIAYAKSFIDKLANGINPIDDSTIPERDVINNVRLSRCLFYVSDILRQVIDNGGITVQPQAQPTVSEKKPKKQPYSLSPEQAANFEYSEKPITATEIFNRILEIGPKEGVKKFPKGNLTKWLISLDLLEEYVSGGEFTKRPTPAGEEIGILTQERMGQYGKYCVLLYNLDAQHFIIENIEAMLDFDIGIYKAKMHLDNQGRPWSSEQDELLIKLYGEGRSLSEIATALKRGEKGVAVRLRNKGFDIDWVAEAKPASTLGEVPEPFSEVEIPVPPVSVHASVEKPEEIITIEIPEPPKAAESPVLHEKRRVEEVVKPEKTCQTCRFARSGECFPQKEICPDYEGAFNIPKEERAAWPEMGDASFLRQTGKYR